MASLPSRTLSPDFSGTWEAARVPSIATESFSPRRGRSVVSRGRSDTVGALHHLTRDRPVIAVRNRVKRKKSSAGDSAPEARLRQPAHAGLEHEDGAGQRLAGALLLGQARGPRRAGEALHRSR